MLFNCVIASHSKQSYLMKRLPRQPDKAPASLAMTTLSSVGICRFGIIREFCSFMKPVKKDTNRIAKVNSLIQHELGPVLHEFLDWQKGLVTITKVETSNDMK